MDNREDKLREKLVALEKRVMDNGLQGQGEEIWARMLNVRERGRQLTEMYEKAGGGLSNEQTSGLEEETMKKAKKVCLALVYVGAVADLRPRS